MDRDAVMGADMEVVFTPWPYDAVARGVALLDEKVPGWRAAVDDDELNMAGCFNCVLGHVFGDFVPGVRALGMKLGHEDVTTHGFSLEQAGPGTWDDLTEVWREAIAGGAE